MNDVKQLSINYKNDGFVSPVNIIDSRLAIEYRKKLETAEKKVGQLHYKTKVYTILPWVYEIAINSKILNLVEEILGPNILLHNATFIIKEANSPSHVSWHQDLTYWGFSNDDQVSVWLALSPSNELSGTMQMIPGSHKTGIKKHKIIYDKNNVLLQGQTVEEVDENRAILCNLAPGQASFHHGWTLHNSKPNRSLDRRIGINFQYLATHVKQTKHNNDSAICVRGIDKYNNFEKDEPAIIELESSAVKKFLILDERYKKTAGS